jgi:hypothetical protein
MHWLLLGGVASGILDLAYLNQNLAAALNISSLVANFTI